MYTSLSYTHLSISANADNPEDGARYSRQGFVRWGHGAAEAEILHKIPGSKGEHPGLCNQRISSPYVRDRVDLLTHASVAGLWCGTEVGMLERGQGQNGAEGQLSGLARSQHYNWFIAFNFRDPSPTRHSTSLWTPPATRTG